MTIILKTLDAYNSKKIENASINLLEKVEELNTKKLLKCEHKNIGTSKHYLEIVFKNENIFREFISQI